MLLLPKEILYETVKKKHSIGSQMNCLFSESDLLWTERRQNKTELQICYSALDKGFILALENVLTFVWRTIWWLFIVAN